MALFSFSDRELADEAVKAAADAWEAGHRHFVHELRAGVGSKNDFGALLTLALDGITEVGWRLHSLTPYINTIGPNKKEALLAFDRP